MAYTNADRMADLAPPALFAQDIGPLFTWARERALASREVARKIAEQEARLDECERVLHETMEWREADAARERLSDAKKAALDADDETQGAKEDLKAARKALKVVDAAKEHARVKKSLKALREVLGETRAEVTRGLADGKVPSMIEADPKS